MTIYIEKSGTDINTDYTEKGIEDNGIDYNPSGPDVDCKFLREPDWNAWIYDLGITLTEADDFWGRIDFKTSLYQNSSKAKISIFGFFDSSADGITNTVTSEIQHQNASTQYLIALIFDGGSSPHVGTIPNPNLTDYTEYYTTISWDSTAKKLTVKVYDSGDNLLATSTLNYAGSFSVDSFGISNRNNASSSGYTIAWEVTYFKCNSGTTEELAPDPPDSVTATYIADDNIKVDWSDSNPSIDGFQIERKDDVGSWSLVHTAGSSDSTWYDTTTASNKRYQYRIRGYIGIAYSDYTESNYVYTTPAPPSNFTLTNGSIVLDWTDDATWEQGFQIQKRIFGDEWEDLVTLNEDVETYTDNITVVQGIGYEYRIRSYRTFPNALYSDWVSQALIYSVTGAVVYLTDQNGDVEYLYPISVKLKISQNASSELTLALKNPAGLGSAKVKEADMITIKIEFSK
jgi:hypothetical protein